MSKKGILRLVSFIMLLVAVIFVFCALSNPGLGRVIWIGSFQFGPKQWRICYALYAIIMVGLFVASFFVKGKKS